MPLSATDQARVDALKRLLGQALGDYTDDQLLALLDSVGSANAVAGQVWGEYAARTATLFDMAEGSSKRNLGDLYEQGLRMAQHFRAIADEPGTGSGAQSTTLPIRRA